MKPPLFHVGQAVACIEQGQASASAAPFLPRLDAVYTVAEVIHYQSREMDECEGGWFLNLAEQSAHVLHHESLFVPVEQSLNEALAELLAETLEPVTA